VRKTALAIALLSVAAPASAQTPYEHTGIDTTVAMDVFGGQNVSSQPQITVDIVGTAQLAKGWQVYVRPWFRLARPGTPTGTSPPWDAMLYQASLRYERTGPVSTRVEIGYMPSPIGLALFDVDPRQNPTIADHASYGSPMLPFDPGAWKVPAALTSTYPVGGAMPAIAATYPLAGLVTVSTERWDARAGVANSAPVRISVAFAEGNPRSMPVFEGGAGITPVTGLRFGMSFAYGVYLTNVERQIVGDRKLTLTGFEAEYAFGHTKMSGEVIHDGFTMPSGDVGATEWFIQAAQTLTPRWSVAGRHEGTLAPVVGKGVAWGAQPYLLSNEITAAFRVNRDLLLKTSYYTRQPYGQLTWDHQARCRRSSNIAGGSSMIVRRCPPASAESD
jgi:hypothetical protein